MSADSTTPHDPPDRATAESSPAPSKAPLSEDWAAFTVGLVLLLAALIGAIPAGVIP